MSRISAMSLGEKQRHFAWMISQLIVWAYDKGYEVSFGEAHRTPEQAEINYLGPVGRKELAGLIRARFPTLASLLERNPAGIASRASIHCDRLAVDLNLFREGVWLTTTEAHRPLGEYWEGLGGSWGGRFGDGNHYSLAHDGRK